MRVENFLMLVLIVTGLAVLDLVLWLKIRRRG